MKFIDAANKRNVMLKKSKSVKRRFETFKNIFFTKAFADININVTGRTFRRSLIAFGIKLKVS